MVCSLLELDRRYSSQVPLDNTSEDVLRAELKTENSKREPNVPISLSRHRLSLVFARPHARPKSNRLHNRHHMQYSSTHEVSERLVRHSPDGKTLALAHAYNLVLRHADTLQILSIHKCVDKIDHLEWSHDSKIVLVACTARHTAHVVDVHQPDWHCKIDEGPLGLAHARLAPDGRHVLTVAEAKLRLTIWSLLDRSVRFIRCPKHADAGLAFSPDGAQMVLAHRADGHDELRVYVCDDGSFGVVRAFEVASDDLADVRWSPSADALCVLDGLLSPQVLLYTPEGAHIATHRLPDAATCDGLGTGLGARAAEWSACGALLALGCRDGRLQLLNSLTWQRVADLRHPRKVRSSLEPDAAVYVETAAPVGTHGGGRKKVFPSPKDRVYRATQPPVDVEPAASEGGVDSVSMLSWSAGGRFLASRSDGTRRAVRVWDSSRFALSAMLIHLSDVAAFAWHPSRQLLAVCTGGPFVFLWSPSGCRSAPLPEGGGFRVVALAWSPTEDALVLIDEERFCVCFIALPPEPATADAATNPYGVELQVGVAKPAEPDEPALGLSSAGLADEPYRTEDVESLAPGRPSADFAGDMLYGLPPSIPTA